MPVMRHLNVGGTTYDTVGEASVTQVLSSGTKIATVSIDGTSTDLYAPEGGSSVDPATAAPSMDGTAAVGSSAKYAREDHVHPSDTSKQATLVSGTNIKTVNGNSLLGSGDLTVSGSVSMDDTAVDAAVAAAFGVEVTVSLTNPISPSNFGYCYIEEASDSTDFPEYTVQLGAIDSPTGSTTVTVPGEYPYLGIIFGGTSVTSGEVSCTGGVTHVGWPTASHVVFSVSSAGTITIDGIDYND